MDKKTRNLELEAWLIETTGEEMMSNHLGPNWNRFNDEFGFYPNISMTIADQVWQHQQARVEELQKRVDSCIRLIKKWSKDAEYADQIAQEDSVHNTLQDCTNELEQALKGETTPNINIDEKGECRHFSTTMFSNGKAECFHCDAIVNEKREVIGRQSKGFSWPSKEGDQ